MFYLSFPVCLLWNMLGNPLVLNLILGGHMPCWLQTHHLLMLCVSGPPMLLNLFIFLMPRSPLSIVTSVLYSLVCLIFICSSQLSFMHPYASAEGVAFLCSMLNHEGRTPETRLGLSLRFEEEIIQECTYFTRYLKSIWNSGGGFQRFLSLSEFGERENR